jgi:anti-sigma28 factor (negative regulator of flagellin synthesis)
MGMLRDKKYHESLGRKDDPQRKHMVADARNAIYQGRYAVDGERVNKMLMEQSLAPVAVGTCVQLG